MDYQEWYFAKEYYTTLGILVLCVVAVIGWYVFSIVSKICKKMKGRKK